MRSSQRNKFDVTSFGSNLSLFFIDIASQALGVYFFQFKDERGIRFTDSFQLIVHENFFNIALTRGVVCPGCVACKKRIFTMPQFMEHLAYDVLPKIIQ